MLVRIGTYTPGNGPLVASVVSKYSFFRMAQELKTRVSEKKRVQAKQKAARM